MSKFSICLINLTNGKHKMFTYDNMSVETIERYETKIDKSPTKPFTDLSIKHKEILSFHIKFYRENSCCCDIILDKPVDKELDIYTFYDLIRGSQVTLEFHKTEYNYFTKPVYTFEKFTV